ILVVAASDTEFESIRAIAAEFDVDEARGDFEYRIIALENSRVADLRDTIDGIASNMLWERRDRTRNQQAPSPDDRFYIQSNDRLNAFVLLGEGGTMDTMQEIIQALDVGSDVREEMIVRAVEVPGRADMNAMRRLIQEVMTDPSFEWWWGDRDPEAVEVQVDTARRLMYLVGKKARVDLAESYITQLAGAGGGEDREIASIQLEYAQAQRAGQALQRFFQDRAEAEGLREDQVSIIGSSDGNVLMVAADTESMAILREFVAQIDQPELGTGRKTEIYYLRHADAVQLATTVRDLFPSTRGDDRMIVIPQKETNMVIVSSPQDTFADVDALIAQLDQPPPDDVTTIRTITLTNGQASIVAEQLDAAIPEMINLKITPVTRSNALMLTGSPEAIELAIAQVEQLDQLGPQRSQQLLRVRLQHAMADDVDFTLSQMLRNRQRPAGVPIPTVDFLLNENTVIVLASPDELEEIAQWIEELDVPLDESRRTEFVKLKFADAEQTANALDVFYGRLATEARTPGARNVKIVPDPASNSLVISADETEWENIMALLERFDTEEYDTTRNLEVIPLKHADARSVARALNEGFQAPLEQRLREEQVRLEQERRNRQQNNSMFIEPRVLVESDETPSVAAEPQTNS
ncbi:MAG: hypothetical protein KDA28_03740, partial [Phycisphaerales bacterium]|nr:hypothetical protein [Phycisphaerales bacterium]